MADRQRELIERVARRAMSKTAGEVRFIKDHGGDKNEWGWGTPGPSERDITPDYKFDPKNLKPLAECLRSGLAGLGHAMRAYSIFTKIKSATISPDGNLGGKGYIQKIAEMRRQLMNAVEAMSAFSDTVYDELHAPHWNPAIEGQGDREREQVKDLLTDAEEIKSDPEGWAEDEEAEMDEGKPGAGEEPEPEEPEAGEPEPDAAEAGGGFGKQASALPPDKADHLVTWLTGEGYDKATAKYEVGNLQRFGLVNLDPSVQKDIRRGLKWVRRQARLVARVAARHLQAQGEQA